MKQNFTVRQGALDGVEAFLSVARHRSFRKAADELGVTTSAVSQAIRVLEARVGVALFIRTTRSVGLTEAGERYCHSGNREHPPPAASLQLLSRPSPGTIRSPRLHETAAMAAASAQSPARPSGWR